jgi:hypothetical protein
MVLVCWFMDGSSDRERQANADARGARRNGYTKSDTPRRTLLT